MKIFIAISLLTFLFFTSCGLLSSGGDSGNGPRTILFSGQVGGGTYQIFAMREDGTGITQLTIDDEQYAMNPAWSPDGTRIAFESSIKAPVDTPNIYVMDADGGNIHPLVTNPNTDGYPMPGRNPAWSPDGTKLAFDYCPTCEAGASNYDIFVADLQSGTIDTLTHNPASDRFPTWSPDGKQIAFASDRDYMDADTARYRKDLYMINVNGTHLNRLTEIGRINIPRWGPTKNYIALAYQQFDADIFLLNLKSNKIRKLTNLKAVGAPLWNYDGSRLLILGTTNENKHVSQLITKDGSLEKEIKLNFDHPENTRYYDWYSK